MKLTQTKRTFVFEMDKYFPSAHASTLVRLPDGHIAAACFGGEHEGADDVKIHVAVEDENGVFAYSARVCADEGLPHWNPVMYVRENGDVALWFKIGKYIPSWKTMYCVSRDGCRSFTEPVCIDTNEAEARGPVKNKPVCLSDGTLIAPRSLETLSDWTVIPEYSTDEGESWNECSPIKYRSCEAMENGYKTIKTNGLIQPSIWEDKNGTHMLMRSTWGRLWRTDSSDFGRSWSDAYETAVPNNNSGIDLAASDGDIFLVYNPVTGNFAARTPLDIAVSRDGGASFEHMLTLESEKGEFSYPSIIVHGDTLHCAYTWNRRNIVYTEVKIER
ncbi:MAG: sialidase family protein [Eubacteriales bacterium]